MNVRSFLSLVLLASVTVLCTIDAQLVINELNADNPSHDTAEFIELYDGGRGNTSLNDYQLVFFNGNMANDSSYLVIDLANKTTNGNGYFVIGTDGVFPPVDLQQSPNFLQNGADAVALYNSTRRWSTNEPPSKVGLVDAIVYGNKLSSDTDLVTALLPAGQTQLHENSGHLDNNVDESLSRCQCCQTLLSSVFRLSPVTPGATNICNGTVMATATPTPQLQSNYTVCKSRVLINEINSDSPGFDANEFIELYDGGRGNSDLSGYVLVLFNGNGDSSYLTVPLTGYKTDKNGYLLVGGVSLDPDIPLPPNTVQNGPDAVTLYIDFPVNFPYRSPPTASKIADVVVYGTRDRPAKSLLSILQPTGHQVNEDWEHHPGEESISRCWSHAQVHPESFVLTHPTPRQPNNCSGRQTPAPPTPVITKTCQVFGRQSLLSTSPGILINEVITDQETSGDAEFVELYDGGRGNSSLDGYALYIVNGSRTEVTCILLSDHQTGSSGYFLIGTSSVKPTPSIVKDVLDVDSGAIVLYSDQSRCQPYLSVQNLVDAVVFGKGQRTDTFLGILTPLDNAILYSPSTGCSIARTADRMPLDLLSFSLQSPTPGQPNRGLPCGTSLILTLVISEVNADDPETDDVEFLELYDGGVGNTNLDGFIVVSFNGNSENDVSYLTVDLRGQQTNKRGYFVMGTAAVTPVDLIQKAGFLQNGADAVAIYLASPNRFPDGSAPTQKGLVDVIVYSARTYIDYNLVNTLLPNQTQAYENPFYIYNGDETLSRCQCCQANNISVYRIGRPTPGDINDCSLTSPVTPTPPSQFTACKFNILVNEINADSPGNDESEFIELYDGGRGNVALDGLVLVLFNGNNGDRSYLTIPLTGYQTDGSGYFLMGSAQLSPEIVLPPHSVQNGADGVALYLDSPSAFPMETVATSNNIVDGVVYGTNDNPDYSLIAKLLPTIHQVNEDWEHHAGEESISRCFSQNQLHPESFQLSYPTPRQTNNCTGYKTPAPPTPFIPKTCQIVERQSLLSTSTEVLISEVVTDQESSGDAEFVELYDGGRGKVSLNGYALYIINGSRTEVTCIMLSGYQTDSSGYFLVGTSSVKPTPSIIQDVLDIDFGAVALYSTQVRCQSFLSVQNLVDAVVFGKGNRIGTLLGVLTPLDNAIRYNPLSGCSFGRSTDRTPLNLLSFSLQSPTPGQSNARPSSSCVTPLIPAIVINEVNADDPEIDDVEFLELYDGGVGNTNLDGFIVVFFNGNLENDVSYLTINLKGQQTNGKGYFVIGTIAVTPAVDLIQKADFLQNGVDAVAIYWSQATGFPDGSVPTQKGLVDAIVYSSNTNVDSDLVSALLPKQTQAYENPFFIYYGDETLSRCQCCQTNNMSVYRIGRPTPGDINDCSLTAPVTPSPPSDFHACRFNILINEINADSPGFDDSEFIELYDGGNGNTPLDGLILVLFNGNFGDKSYLTIPLMGYQTDSNGYFLLGSAQLRPEIVLPANSVQNGPDGVALYLDSPTAFPKNTVATSNNIVDSVVYGTNDHLDYSLIIELLPTFHQVNEDWEHHAGEESISRCFSVHQLHPKSFQLAQPTPRQPNNCTGLPTPPPVTGFTTSSCRIQDRQSLIQTSPEILINEVSIMQSGNLAYVELYDRGRGGVNLSGIAVYVFGADTMEVLQCWPMSLGVVTNPTGYFIVGQYASNMKVGAVALYARQQDTGCRSYGSVEDLADAVVFGSGRRIEELLTLLTPGQTNLSDAQSDDYTVSRCQCCSPLSLQSFGMGTPTPGRENECQSVSRPEQTSDGGLSSGATAGIALSVIVTVAVLLLLAGVVLYRRRKPEKSTDTFEYKKSDGNTYVDY